MAAGGLLQEEDEGSEPASFKSDAEGFRAASAYAWEYFKLHAQQRQAVFRFYLIVIAAILAGLVSILSARTENQQVPVSVFGLLLVISSFLFWRLDARNLTLVRVAEEYLLVDEKRLEKIVGSSRVRLVAMARASTSQWIFVRIFQKFKHIYRIIFLLVAILGVTLIYSDAAVMQKGQDFLFNYAKSKLCI